MTGFDIYIAPPLADTNTEYQLRIKANQVDVEQRRSIKARLDRMEALREQKEIDDMFI